MNTRMQACTPMLIESSCISAEHLEAEDVHSQSYYTVR